MPRKFFSAKIGGVKKRFLLPLLTLLPLAGSLVSCEREITPIQLPFGELFDATKSSYSFHALSYGRLENFVDEGASFLLIVRGTDTHCICWSRFAAEIERYMKEENARVYIIDKAELSEKRFGIKVQDEANAIAVFENGKVKHQVLVKDGSKMAETEGAIGDWIRERVTFANVYYVNIAQLEELYSSDLSGFVLGVGRESCSDCRYAYHHLLQKEAGSLNHRSYLFDVDVDGARFKNGAYDEDTWTNWKDEYGLSETYNADFGYATGFVPTWLYVVPGSFDRHADLVKDMCVWGNDGVSKEGETYKITRSYWNETREHEFLSGEGNEGLTSLEGMAIPAAQAVPFGGDEYGWDNKYGSVYHDPYLKAFLHFYLD